MGDGARNNTHVLYGATLKAASFRLRHGLYGEFLAVVAAYGSKEATKNHFVDESTKIVYYAIACNLEL